MSISTHDIVARMPNFHACPPDVSGKQPAGLKGFTPNKGLAGLAPGNSSFGMKTTKILRHGFSRCGSDVH